LLWVWTSIRDVRGRDGRGLYIVDGDARRSQFRALLQKGWRKSALGGAEGVRGVMQVLWLGLHGNDIEEGGLTGIVRSWIRTGDILDVV
jgi:hypothetical protein